MKVQGSYTFDAPLETVWNALFDPEVLARTLPGCEKLERHGDQFTGDINVKMGPVQGKFHAKVDIRDIEERVSYMMIVDGRGPAGFGKATALMRVSVEGAGTRLEYESDVQVGGKIASVGQRLIDASSRAIVKQSLEGLNAQIRALGTAAPAGAAASTAEEVPAPAGDLPVGPGPRPAAAPDGAGEPGADGGASGAAAAAAADLAAAKAAAPRPAQPGLGSAPSTSQAAFALGVAKEVTKELFPLRTVLLIVGLVALGWMLLRSLGGD